MNTELHKLAANYGGKNSDLEHGQGTKTASAKMVYEKMKEDASLATRELVSAMRELVRIRLVRGFPARRKGVHKLIEFINAQTPGSLRQEFQRTLRLLPEFPAQHDDAISWELGFWVGFEVATRRKENSTPEREHTKLKDEAFQIWKLLGPRVRLKVLLTEMVTRGLIVARVKNGKSYSYTRPDGTRGIIARRTIDKWFTLFRMRRNKNTLTP
ncbi:MAG TPA: hypothetical protein PKX00_01330 [Opitutaceae bacterium]|nr:hypothetical protein [Opitutaceae bacterium]